MVSLSSLGKSFGDHTLFAGVSVRLNTGCRYGLVGANGSGKTTLLHILAGHESHTEGDLMIPSATRIGVLEQDRFLGDEQAIIDVAMMGDRPVWEALAEKVRLLDADEPDGAAIADVEDRIQMADGYTLESRSAAVLEGLGIAGPNHHQPLSTLSGGFRLRVLLAQTLIAKPDLLLLDEPTNHLDILTIRWLEDYLCAYDGCAVVVSHDHRFIDRVATHILDVDYATVTLYVGNYTNFIAEKEQTRARKEAEIAKQQQAIAEKKAFIERFRAKNTKARQAQSRVKQIEKIEIEELPQSSRRAPVFRFEQRRKSGRDVVELDGISKAYGDNRVLDNVSLSVRRGERVAVIGVNGIGKSTLQKILVDQVSPDAGEVRWGYETSVGYFAQDHRELLADRKTTALEYLWEICPQEPTSFVRGQLGRMLLSGEDADKKVGSLSGGEAARLILSRIVVQKPNVLVLDEPTNHLDLESIEALVAALQAYSGTVIFVSHDRWFVSKLADRVIELTPAGMHDYQGTYEEYLAHAGDDHLDARTVVAKAKRERAAEKAAAVGQATHGWEEQKRRRNLHRKLCASRDRATEAIEQAEARLAEIQERYCEPGFFEQTPSEDVAAIEREQAALGPRIEQLMAEWEQLETELEQLGKL
ncbi:MAG: ABC-F family ATPase [Deltaproteobacteria bacterium]|nr:MAG: ABC-F family ATPase [Deltaproteobacteria bacterium]